MPVSSVSSSPTATAKSQLGKSADSIAQTFDQFLTLLTTQLRYQDPLSPMDTNEFTSQLVQFSQVEQQILQNQNLETLIALQGANQVAFAASMTGKTIEFEGNSLSLTEGESLSFNYTLSGTAGGALINILDANGNTVYSTQGKTAGETKHNFVWDGRKADGTQAPEGTYRIEVVATDPAGQPLKVSYTAEANVRGVDLTDGLISLDVGSFTVSLDNIVAIREPKKATPA